MLHLLPSLFSGKNLWSIQICKGLFNSKCVPAGHKMLSLKSPPVQDFRSHITFMKVAHRSRDRPPVLMLQNPTRMFMLNPDLSWGQGNFLPLEKWVWKRGVSNCDREPFCAAEIRPKTQLSVGFYMPVITLQVSPCWLEYGSIISPCPESYFQLLLWDGWWSILTSTYTQGWALWGTTPNMKWQQMCSILCEGHQHNTVQHFFFLIDVEFALFPWHFTVFSCNSVQITFVQFWSCRISYGLLFISLLCLHNTCPS